MKLAARLVVSFALTSIAVPASSQELGRLFFTAEQRSALDARRKAKPPVKPAAAVPSRSTRIDGYILRSSGKSTIWINSETISEGSQPVEGKTLLRRDEPGRISVPAGGGRRRDLRVGETLEAGAGDARDVIGDGEIKVRR